MVDEHCRSALAEVDLRHLSVDCPDAGLDASGIATACSSGTGRGALSLFKRSATPADTPIPVNAAELPKTLDCDGQNPPSARGDANDAARSNARQRPGAAVLAAEKLIRLLIRSKSLGSRVEV